MPNLVHNIEEKMFETIWNDKIRWIKRQNFKPTIL